MMNHMLVVILFTIINYYRLLYFQGISQGLSAHCRHQPAQTHKSKYAASSFKLTTILLCLFVVPSSIGLARMQGYYVLTVL